MMIAKNNKNCQISGARGGRVRWETVAWMGLPPLLIPLDDDVSLISSFEKSRTIRCVGRFFIEIERKILKNPLRENSVNTKHI